jgi:hypothetical protein
MRFVSGLALGRDFSLPVPRVQSETLTRRGWPLSSKKMVTMPLWSASPIPRQRITRVCLFNNRAEYLPERRQALDAWSEYVARLVARAKRNSRNSRAAATSRAA